jgi:hypothetical protein
MGIFAWFILAHLLGDWLLQNDWMALGKRQGLFTWAGVSHCTIYTGAILAGLGVSAGLTLQPPLWAIISLVVFLSHWLIDTTNLVQGWMAVIGQRNQTMVRVMVDQTLHLLVLGLLVQFFLSGVK